MKIRIHNNSFRFRLKEFEVESLQQQRMIKESVEFGLLSTSALSFSLQLAEKDDFGLSFEPGNIIFYLPETEADQWMKTNRVGIEHDFDAGKGKTIRLLIEKDFTCMDTCAENNIGSYPHPLEK